MKTHEITDRFGKQSFDIATDKCRPSRQLRRSIEIAESPVDFIAELKRRIEEAIAKNQEQLTKKFCRLVAEWKAERGPYSSSAKLAMHPAYQKIIGMGKEVVPLILQELKTNPDSWFWALASITDEDPVKEEDQGNLRAMAAAWIEWGKQQGFQID